jgi:protein-L-isoaspartate O-methyltransferase
VDRAFWERAADGYHEDCLAARVPEIVERVLRWVGAGDAVLEVGAGSGGFTLPVAQRAARVTALDYSPAMLRVLEENVRRAGLDNVTAVAGDLESAPRAPHDVVLAANALYRVRDARPVVERLLRAARKRLLVVWSVGQAQPWERVARETVAPGRYRAGPDYIHLLDVLYELGADAEVELLTVAHERIYPSEDEAVAALATWPSPTREELGRCRELLPTLLEQRAGGGYVARVRDRIALLRCESDP